MLIRSSARSETASTRHAVSQVTGSCSPRQSGTQWPKSCSKARRGWISRPTGSTGSAERRCFLRRLSCRRMTDLPHQEDPEAEEQHEREQTRQQRPPRRRAGPFRLEGDFLLLEQLL